MAAVSRKGSGGFTLLELLFVLFILAVLFSAAIPRMNNAIDSIETRNFLSDLVAFSGYARAKSVSSSFQYRIRLDLDEKKILLETKADEKWRVERIGRIPKKLPIEPLNGEKSILFYPDGSCSDFSARAGSGVLRYRVTTNPSCGVVNVIQEP